LTKLPTAHSFFLRSLLPAIRKPQASGLMFRRKGVKEYKEKWSVSPLAILSYNFDYYDFKTSRLFNSGTYFINYIKYSLLIGESPSNINLKTIFPLLAVPVQPAMVQYAKLYYGPFMVRRKFRNAYY
jgi:hypothetical protein